MLHGRRAGDGGCLGICTPALLLVTRSLFESPVVSVLSVASGFFHAVHGAGMGGWRWKTKRRILNRKKKRV
jgi:hypothetical protein